MKSLSQQTINSLVIPLAQKDAVWTALSSLKGVVKTQPAAQQPTSTTIVQEKQLNEWDGQDFDKFIEDALYQLKLSNFPRDSWILKIR